MEGAPLSELFGRRYIFVVTLLVFTIFSMANALAPNFGSILTFRFLAGERLSLVVVETRSSNP